MDEKNRFVMKAKTDGYLKIRDVCELLKISPHTLRYWEKEFSEYIEPFRSVGGHRLYDDHAIRKLLELRHLLKEEMYSINGARKQLNLLVKK